MTARDTPSLPEHLTIETELSPSMAYRVLERHHIDVVFDPLASTSGIAGYFKLQNLRVIANDLALYVYVKGKALWENNRFELPADTAAPLLQETAKLPPADHYGTLGGPWLLDEERQWLEFWRREINEFRDEYHRAIAETAVSLVIDFWITSKRFGTASEWEPPRLLAYYIDRINQSLMDNKESNEMWCTNPVELTEKVVADVLFINPPPLKGYAALGVREQTIESWLRGRSDFPLERIAPPGTIGGVFDSVDRYMTALGELLKAAEHIPLWAFALSNRQPFTRLQFSSLLRALGRNWREVDLKIAKEFFSVRAADTIVVAMK